MGSLLIFGFHKTTLFRALFSPPLAQRSSSWFVFPGIGCVWLLSHIFWCCLNLIVRLKSERRRTSSGTTTSGSNTSVFISLHSVTVRKGKGKERTQFIPGALPPKLKLDGTTGTVNLYPPCFSIIFDSKNNQKQKQNRREISKLSKQVTFWQYTECFELFKHVLGPIFVRKQLKCKFGVFGYLVMSIGEQKLLRNRLLKTAFCLTMCCSPLICKCCNILKMFSLFLIETLCERLVPCGVTALDI